MYIITNITSFKTINTKMNTNTDMSSAVIDNVVVADIICENEKNEKKKIEISFPNEDEAILHTTTTIMSNVSEMNNDKINTDVQTKIKVKKVKDPNAPKKTKKSKTVITIEEDVAVVVAMPEPTHQPVVSATMEMPRSFHIDESVFEDETVVEIPEPTARKWVCGMCERGGNYCDDECRHCRNELCRSCCNDRSVQLEDEPIVEPCGTCGHYECMCDNEPEYDPEETERLRWRNEMMATSIAIPYTPSCVECGGDTITGVCVCDVSSASTQSTEEEDVEVDEDTSDNCPVCYEATETRTRGCNHKLCGGCYDTLKSGLASYERHVKCPICRTLFTDIQRQMTDAEKIADYDRLREENDRMMEQLNRAIADRDRMRLSRDVARTRMETARAERRTRRRNADGEPRPPRQPRVPRASAGVLEVNEDEEDVVGVELNPREYGASRPALSSTRVVLEDGQRLADIPFSARPRLRCGRNGCVRRTRRCCDGCGNVRACEEHIMCEECA